MSALIWSTIMVGGHIQLLQHFLPLTQKMKNTYPALSCHLPLLSLAEGPGRQNVLRG